jgi:hypothetical protein
MLIGKMITQSRIVQALHEKDLHEIDIDYEIETGRVRPNMNNVGLDVMGHYTGLQDALRFNEDARMIKQTQLSKKKQPVKYAGFIDKFKRSVTNIMSNLEKKKNFAFESVSSDTLKQLAVILKSVETFEFNVFDINALIGNKTLYFVINQIFRRYGYFKEIVNETKFLNFIKTIINGYDRNIPYHNDLHATDVLQTTFLQIEKGKLLQVF